MLIGRSAVAAALTALTAVAVTACGTQQGGQPRSDGPPPASDPRPSSGPRPKCAQPSRAPTVPPASPSSAAAADGGGRQEADGGSRDRPPHYAENHAYRQQEELTGRERAWGEASAELVREEMEKVRREGGADEYGLFDAERIAAALRRLGCGEEHGVYVGDGFYSVHTGTVCVSGRVARDELTGKVHGAYAEPQPGTGPCVENRGGH